MIYMLTAWYPFSKIREVMKVMNKMPKMPEYIKKWQIFGTADGKKGTKVYNLIMVKDGVTDDAAIFITKLQTQFTDEIDGYVWKIETVMGIKDSMKVLQG